MSLVVETFDFTAPFAAAMAAAADADPELYQAAKDALELLRKNPQARSLRVHALKGYGKPTIFKMDVYTNHSWQITFEMLGTKAVLRRLATHKDIDRNPR